jgi:TolB-like protein/Tfp pilus assembly protein PilF
MAAKFKFDLHLEIAHVLFIDVVGYSKLLVNEQREVVEQLNRAVRRTPQFRKSEGAGKLIRIPVGDGMALVFFQTPEEPVQCAMEIARTLKNHPQIRLRMGVHSGPVDEVKDVNDRLNLAGAGMNTAQRVMACGDAGHILLSKRVAEDLAQDKLWQPHLHELGEIELKHGRKLGIVNLYSEEIGNPKVPEKLKGPSRQPAERPLAVGWPRLIKIAALLVVCLLAAIAVIILLRHRGSYLPSAQTPPAPARETSVAEKSIAVLPFENLSHDPDNAYFADGIQEEIFTRLSKIADLKVISRTSTRRFKSTPEDLRQIAQQLGVANVLEGSVQKAADQVRVNVQLINAATDRHLWADTYDRKLTDIFAVESEIAKTVADRLQAKLTGAEQRAIASRPTENSEAHQLYLRGRFYWNKVLGPEFDKSRQYYQQAIELDPNYALAYAGLADFYGFALGYGLLPPEEKWAKMAEDMANKALELDPTLGEAYNPLAAAKLYYHRDWPAAERDFRRGFELSPNFAEMHAHYAVCLILFGRKQEAFAEMQRALDLDPLSPRFGFWLGWLYFFARQYDTALEQFRKTLELDPNLPILHEYLGYTYEKKQMQKEAIAEWSKGLRLIGTGEDASLLERTYTESGFDAALRALTQKRLETFKEKTGRGEYVPAREYVVAYMRLGDKEQAFAWLAKACAERNGFSLLIRVNPVLDPLRNDPRFQKLANAQP